MSGRPWRADIIVKCIVCGETPKLLNVGEQTYFSLNNNMQSQRLYFSTAFSLSVLGYCKNMAVQHGGLRGKQPAPHVDINGSF